MSQYVAPIQYSQSITWLCACVCYALLLILYMVDLQGIQKTQAWLWSTSICHWAWLMCVRTYLLLLCYQLWWPIVGCCIFWGRHLQYCNSHEKLYIILAIYRHIMRNTEMKHVYKAHPWNRSDCVRTISETWNSYSRLMQQHAMQAAVHIVYYP